MSGTTGRGFDVGRGLAAIRDVAQQLRPYADERTAERPEHGDVRDDVLSVLSAEPASGYRIVQVLGERGRETTAGAVYPVLQLLQDEGLATSEEADGRRIWTLTAAGRTAAEGARRRPADPEQRKGPSGRLAVVRSGAQLTQTVALAAQTATQDQTAEVVAVLDEARRRVLAILARD